MSISMKKFKAGLLAGARAGGPELRCHSPVAGRDWQQWICRTRGLNAKGRVAGRIDAADGHLHAFVYDGEKMIDLGTLGGVNAEANAINGLGQATGWVIVDNETGSSRGFFYDGTTHDLGTLGGTETFGFDINDHGQITGDATGADGIRRAFLYQNGMISPLPTPGVRGPVKAFSRLPL